MLQEGTLGGLARLVVAGRRWFFDDSSTERKSISYYYASGLHEMEFMAPAAPAPAAMHRPFWIGDWFVDPATCRIRSADTEVKLEPKAMTVLVCLAEHAGEVLSREQIEAMAWQGVVVGYDSLASSIIKLRRGFGDDPRNPRIIETVPKRGYRLIAPVRAGAPESEPAAAPDARPDAPVPPPRRRRRPALLSLIAVPAVLIALGVLIATSGLLERAPVAAEPAVAVLPFKNLSDDPDQEYFSDGITADLITDLSKISSLAVIARNSVFQYKDRDVDVRELGDELGVAYVVEGSVRKAGDTVRITASLIDAGTGHNLWAERFDGKLQDIFALQDEVTHKVVSSLAVTLTERERATLARDYTRSIEAYDEFLQGWQAFWVLSKESNAHAREHFLNAIALDGHFARAYANLALTYAYDYINAWHDDPDYSIGQARLYARKGLELDPDLPQAHWAMSLVHAFGRDYQAALEEVQLNLRDAPHSADAHGLMADILNFAGRPKQALEVMHKAMRLNPHYQHIYLIIRGEIHFNLHDYPQAIRDLEAALARNPEAQEARLWLAAAYAHANQPDEASWQLEHIRHAGIELTLDYLERVVPMNDPIQRRHLLDGLHKAGMTDSP
jgi:TolB-like protein/DNA-binding winged helix-turn-helix (wHTH) protein/Flp pilus assembly protein TadD